MHSLNRVTLIGHLAADPEVRQTTTGKTVANFPIATNRDWYDSEGKKQQATDFHRIIAWQKLGEICGNYLKKGSAICVEGRISNRNYEDKEGKTRYITEIVSDDINIFTWKKSRDGAEEVNMEQIKKAPAK